MTDAGWRTLWALVAYEGAYQANLALTGLADIPRHRIWGAIDDVYWRGSRQWAPWSCPDCGKFLPPVPTPGSLIPPSKVTPLEHAEICPRGWAKQQRRRITDARARREVARILCQM